MKTKALFIITLLFISMFSLTIVTSAQESPLYTIRSNNAIDKDTEVITNSRLKVKTELNIPVFRERLYLLNSPTMTPSVNCECPETNHIGTCQWLCPTRKPIICFFIYLLTIGGLTKCHISTCRIGCPVNYES